MAPEVFRIDDSIRVIQSARLQSLRERRDNAAVQNALQRISQAAGTSENLMPLVVEAVEHLCTLGEISDVLREVWGEYK